jgi:hypothetical protein
MKMGRFEDKIKLGLQDPEFAEGYAEAQAEWMFAQYSIAGHFLRVHEAQVGDVLVPLTFGVTFELEAIRSEFTNTRIEVVQQLRTYGATVPA